MSSCALAMSIALKRYLREETIRPQVDCSFFPAKGPEVGSSEPRTQRVFERSKRLAPPLTPRGRCLRGSDAPADGLHSRDTHAPGHPTAAPGRAEAVSLGCQGRACNRDRQWGC